jgi:hypothetical protein
MNKFLLILFWILFLSFAVSAQSNKFEGYNIVLSVPENHQTATCTIRYVPPTTDITITDLNPATPMNIRACDGTASTVRRTGATFTMRAGATDFKWCFQGEDKRYRISFQGDQYSGRVVYDWVSMENPTGIYNIKDFGAVGDGRTDDTVAIQSALAFIATKNGGTLQFTQGDYAVGSAPDFKGIILPSGITVQGVSGLHTGASTNNWVSKSPTRITLKGRNRAIFRIGECTEKIALKDIELFAESGEETYGFQAVGAYTSSQDIQFENVVFSSFYRGISIVGLPQTNRGWQCDYVKLNRLRFIYNTDAGIYSNTTNANWKIQSSLFINPQKTAAQNADSMHFERSGGIYLEDTFGGGFPHALGGTYLKVLISGNITVINSQTESMTNSFVLNATKIAGVGDYSYPVTFINSVFGDPIIINERRNFVSVGNLYGPKTFQAGENVRVYSTGDRFCYDGYTLGCIGGNKSNFDRATVIFMTGQLSERDVPAHPTFFGTDVQFGAPVQMPSFEQNKLPAGKPNGSMVYCQNCRRDTTPCQAGGGGAPAMVVGGAWSCL